MKTIHVRALNISNHGMWNAARRLGCWVQLFYASGGYLSSKTTSVSAIRDASIYRHTETIKLGQTWIVSWSCLIYNTNKSLLILLFALVLHPNTRVFSCSVVESKKSFFSDLSLNSWSIRSIVDHITHAFCDFPCRTPSSQTICPLVLNLWCQAKAQETFVQTLKPVWITSQTKNPVREYPTKPQI